MSVFFPKVGVGIVAVMMLIWLLPGESHALGPSLDAAKNEVRIVEFEGTVEVLRVDAKMWVPAQTNQVLRPFDHVRCGPNSRVAFFWSDESVVQAGALAEI